MTPAAHKELRARIDRLTGNTWPRDSTTCRNAHWKDLRDYGLFSDAPDVQEKRSLYVAALPKIVRADKPDATVFDVMNATALQRSRAFLAAFEPKGDEKPLTFPS